MSDTSEIPAVIGEYIVASNAKDIAKTLSLFTDDAVVKDEGGIYDGRLAIADWQKKIHSSYDFHMNVILVKNKESGYIVTTTLSGSFPGKNPVNIKQHFKIQDNKIAELSIQ